MQEHEPGCSINIYMANVAELQEKPSVELPHATCYAAQAQGADAMVTR